MPLKLITWNVNSIRARQERLLALLARHAPDVVCLQEIKCEEATFPAEVLRQAGYHAAVAGQKAYHGVAILAREPLEDVRRGLDDGEDDPQARLISARVRGLRVYSVYIPNGEVPSSPKFTYKLAWMERFARKLAREHTADEPLAVCGDFNVAPTDLDVRNPEKWADTVLCRPEVREKLAHIRRLPLIDALRHLHPDQANLYTYWDYQMLAFPKNDGLRIDHIDVTPPLAARLRAAWIDREERKGVRPSDHAPVIAVFDDE